MLLGGDVRADEFGLGFVEGDVGDVVLRCGEVDGGLGGGMVAPGAYGVEVVEEDRVEAGGEELAAELLREAGGEVLIHDERHEEGVARGPGGWVVVENAKFKGEMRALEGDGGVDAAGVDVEPVVLVGGKYGEGAVGGGGEAEGALGSVVGDEPGAEKLGEGARGVAAEGLHLPEPILRGDEALGEDEVVEGRCADVGDTMGVALDGDGGGEAGDAEGAVELREGVAHGSVGPEAGAEECSDDEDERDDERDGEVARQTRGTRVLVFGGGAVEQIEFVGCVVVWRHARCKSKSNAYED